jgi:hypothetical protein
VGGRNVKAPSRVGMRMYVGCTCGRAVDRETDTHRKRNRQTDRQSDEEKLTYIE